MNLVYSKPAPTRNALKLGGKGKDVDTFVDQLKNEGEKISTLSTTSVGGSTVAARSKPDVPTEE